MAGAIPPWTVVVLAKWNKSILTPAGISSRLLEQKEGEPVQIEVPLNVSGPPRVKGDGVAVLVDEDKLFIEVERDNYDALARAMKAAARAIEQLPETPFGAAGITLTFNLQSVAPNAKVGTCVEWDNALRQKGYQVVKFVGVRFMEWRGGQIMVSTQREGSEGAFVVVNFERRSDKHAELIGWLNLPLQDIKEQSQDLLCLLEQVGIA